jgi:hypothetical protein
LREVKIMAFGTELRLYLRRSHKGDYRLESEDGRVFLRSSTYHQLRRDLETILAAIPGAPSAKILIGTPRKPVIARTDSGRFPQLVP